MTRMKAGKATPGAALPRAAPPARRTRKEHPTGAWHRVLEIARRRLDQFVSLEPKVLKGDDPDAIHDIRVASRRLQQVLDLLYPAPRPQRVRKLRRTIRRARRVLSVARNCDVLLERVHRVLARKRTSRREAWEVFRNYLHERREKSFRKASRRLSKLKLSAFYVRLREYLRSTSMPQSRAEPPGAPAGALESAADERDNLLRARFDQELRKAWSALENGVRAAEETPDAAVFHSVRIAAKKMRYLVEVIQGLNTAGADQVLECLRDLQRHLGDWHDLEVLEEMMLEMVARPVFLRGRLELAMEVEKLVLRNRRSKKTYEEKFFQMTRRSEEWKKASKWVEDFLSATPGGNGMKTYSPAFPPVNT